MSENVEKKRENGFYWVRSKVSGRATVVLIEDDRVLLAGDEDYYYLDRFEPDVDFIEGPLKPLPLDLKLMLEVVAQARGVIASLEESGEIWGADGLVEALRKLDYLVRP